MLHETLINKFRNRLLTSGLQESTIRAYIADVQQYCEWINRHPKKTIQNITEKDAKAFLAFLSETTHELRPGAYGLYSPITIKRKISIIRRFHACVLEEEK